MTRRKIVVIEARANVRRIGDQMSSIIGMAGS
jgi:hypothetical protein